MQAVEDDGSGDDAAEPLPGGDPACWLHQVCDNCGVLVENDEHDCSVRLDTAIMSGPRRGYS